MQARLNSSTTITFYPKDIKDENGSIIYAKSNNQVKDNIIREIGQCCQGKSLHTLTENDKANIKSAMDELDKQTSSLFTTMNSASKIYACVLLYWYFKDIPKSLTDVRNFLQENFQGENVITIYDESALWVNPSQKYFNKITAYLSHRNDNWYNANQNLMAKQTHIFRKIVSAFEKSFDYNRRIEEYRNKYFAQYDNYLKVVPNDFYSHMGGFHENPHVFHSQLIIDNKTKLKSQAFDHVGHTIYNNSIFRFFGNSAYIYLHHISNYYEFYALELITFLYFITEDLRRRNESNHPAIILLKKIGKDFVKYCHFNKHGDHTTYRNMRSFMLHLNIFVSQPHDFQRNTSLNDDPIENLRRFCKD